MRFLGVALDPAANHRNAPTVSSRASMVKVGVEPTNDEWIAAKRARELLQNG